jgi:DNA-binding LacI/PurR family transcriptional regulator
MAYGAMKAMKEAGIRVPDDVSVIGFDDLPQSARMETPLTTISVSKRDMGRRAFDLLAARIAEGRDRPAEKVLIDGALIVRDSVRARPTRWPMDSKRPGTRCTAATVIETCLRRG